MNDDVPWCIICQSSHSSEYCAVPQSFFLGQDAQNEEEEEEKSHDDVSCNMVSMLNENLDSDLEEMESDLEHKKITYQLHHQ